MRSASRIRTLLAVGVLLGVSAGGFVDTKATVASDEGSALPAVGTVVARGVPNGAGACSFGVTEASTIESGQWEALDVGSDCIVTVQSAWTGTLADGPAEYQAVDEDLGVPAAPAVATAAATTCKLAEEFFFTYGYGGAALDKLTRLWSAMNYCYNDTYVWGSNDTGSGCAGQNEPSWNWVVDWCVITAQRFTQSTSSVWSQIRGDYHCTPPSSTPCNLSDPDGYYHSLWDQVTAYPSGHSHCTHWWSGQVVLGPESQIIAGCV